VEDRDPPGKKPPVNVLRGKFTKRDAAIVAAVLLLPIPVLAQSGFGVPLPGGVQRSFGSLVTLDGDDKQTGTQTTGHGSGGTQGERQSGKGSLRIGTGRRGTTALKNGTPGSAAAGSEQGAQKTAGASGSGSGNAPAESEPEGAGDGGGAGSSGDSGTSDDSGGSAGSAGSGSSGESGSSQAASGGPEASSPSRGTGLLVTGSGPGSGAGASAGEDGLGLDLGADDGAAAGEESTARADVTQQDGSTTGVGGAVPGAGGVNP
jgi:hypothetical protein